MSLNMLPFYVTQTLGQLMHELWLKYDLIMHKMCISILTAFVTVEFALDISLSNCAETPNFMKNVMH